MRGEVLDQVASLARRLPPAQVELVALLLSRGEQSHGASLEIPEPQHRTRFLELARTWQEVGGSLTELGAALAASSRTAAAIRNEMSFEPVWTGPLPLFPQVRRTDQVLVELITTAREELLVVCFVTYHVPTVRAALREALARGVRLTFVLEDSAVNPDVEDQDPSRLLGEHPAGSVRRLVWPLSKREEYGEGQVGKLHAKCAVADRDQLLIGSANVSRSAMEHNIELGLLVRGGTLPGLVRDHFDRLWRNGVFESV